MRTDNAKPSTTTDVWIIRLTPPQQGEPTTLSVGSRKPQRLKGATVDERSSALIDGLREIGVPAERVGYGLVRIEVDAGEHVHVGGQLFEAMIMTEEEIAR